LNRFTAALVVVIVVLLSGILFELHGLNRRLGSFDTLTTSFLDEVNATATRSETPAQRKVRLDREADELKQSIEDSSYRLNRALGAGANPKRAPR